MPIALTYIVSVSTDRASQLGYDVQSSQQQAVGLQYVVREFWKELVELDSEVTLQVSKVSEIALQVSVSSDVMLEVIKESEIKLEVSMTSETTTELIVESDITNEVYLVSEIDLDESKEATI
jgi:hypothetical protein